MRELLLAVAIVAAAAIVAASFRYTPILAGENVEGVLDRWTGAVTYPWPDSCEESRDDGAARL
ncbi:MAG: hypothetical protein HYR72_25525 [Deltaproteobacteria bacterium]|nr:hypothetical protein [Deltaproteobacteria bacterium]MBI3388426.1 hypothetical protein [Deltaproteobacteria bacterium]